MPYYHVELIGGKHHASRTIEAASKREAECLGRMWWELTYPETDEPTINIHMLADQHHKENQT